MHKELYDQSQQPNSRRVWTAIKNFILPTSEFWYKEMKDSSFCAEQWNNLRRPFAVYCN